MITLNQTNHYVNNYFYVHHRRSMDTVRKTIQKYVTKLFKTKMKQKNSSIQKTILYCQRCCRPRQVCLQPICNNITRLWAQALCPNRYHPARFVPTTYRLSLIGWSIFIMTVTFMFLFILTHLLSVVSSFHWVRFYQLVEKSSNWLFEK